MTQTKRPQYGATGFHGERGGITPSAHVFRDTAMQDWYLWMATDGTFRWAPADVAEATGFNWNYDGNAIAYREAPDGTAQFPAYTYAADTDTGQFRLGANNEGFSAAGILRWDYNTIRMRLQPGYLLDFGGNATIGADAGGVIINSDLTVNGDISFSGNLTFSEEFLAIDGTETFPAYSFASAANTGMYLKLPGSIGFSAAAVLRMEIASTVVTSYVPITAPTVNATTLNVAGASNFASGTFTGTVSAPTGIFGTLSTTPLNMSNASIGTLPDARLSVNVLKHTGGYPGGALTFLRADGTFATPSGLVPGAHHATHEVGGGDQITGALSVSSITSPSAQFTSIGTTPLPAANLTGTVVDARLTVNVLKYSGGYPGGTTNFLRADGTFAVVTGVLPGAHAASHASAGADPVTVTTLAGYPGGTTNFLRADGTFAVPVATAAAHHANHEPGGSDVLVNSVWTNVGNTFTPVQTFAAAIAFSADSGIRRTVNSGWVAMAGGNSLAVANGAMVIAYGATHANVGSLELFTSTAATARISFYTGSPSTEKGRIHNSGGLSWGGTVDPGAGNLSVTGNIKATNLKWQESHTWALTGELTAAGPLPSMFVSSVGTQTSKIVGLRMRLFGGTSVTIQLFLNGTAQSSVITVTPAVVTTVLNIPVVNNDEVNLALAALTGAPSTLCVTMIMEHTL